MDLFQSDRKRQRISLEEGEHLNILILSFVNVNFLDDGEVGGLIGNNCIQYRVTGGGGSNSGAGSSGTDNTGSGYRVVSSSNSENNANSSNTTSATTTTALSNVQAVLASPINGQFYVIGNPSDVLGGVGQRSIAPRYD